MSSTRSFNLLHLSDLHFGRVHHDILQSLEDFMSQLLDPPHLVILTGDLTQRARKEQFLEAKVFLEKLPCPVFLVPGNHDVPLYNLFLRFFQPYKKFRKYLKPWTEVFYEDDYVAVFGLWTVDNLKIEEGKIPSEQLQMAEEKFRNVKPEKVKILAFHHPILKSQRSREKELLNRIMKIKPDLMMWGHDHQSGAQYCREEDQKFPVLVAAGTTISSRTRQEANSFNWIKLEGPRVEVSTYAFDSEMKQFTIKKTAEFTKNEVGK